MRLLLLLAAVTLPALADSIDGINYTWSFTPDTQWYTEIHVQFSAPISNYQFQLEFPAGSVNPQVWAGQQQPATVTWATVGGGPWVPRQQQATVTGILPDLTSMEITIGVDNAVPGYLAPQYFHFTNLVDPPVMVLTEQADAPEPSTLALIVCGLACSTLMSKIGRAGLCPQRMRTRG